MQNEELFEYETFMFDMDGEEVEMAIIEEFDFEEKHYVLCAEVEDDMINEEDGLYLFRIVSESDDDIAVETIESEEEYNRIVEAYYEMCEAQEE